jgi:uncharacterized protein (TIGR02391 family)
MLYSIMIRVAGFNKGENKYALAISEEQVNVFANAVNSQIEYVLVNGIKFKTQDPELVKVFKIKERYASNSADEIKELMRVDAMTTFRGKISIRILRKFSEEVTDKYITSQAADTAYDFWINIHQSIRTVCQSKFEDRHYADSVESAFKEVNDIVKKEYRTISGKELDGANLMRTVFSPKDPIFRLAEDSDTGRSIQQGYMDLFAGSIQGIRNPKAHANMKIDAIDAWEKIVLASHLLKMWEKRIKL